jgi:hypothetical protein
MVVMCPDWAVCHIAGRSDTEVASARSELLGQALAKWLMNWRTGWPLSHRRMAEKFANESGNRWPPGNHPITTRSPVQQTTPHHKA